MQRLHLAESLVNNINKLVEKRESELSITERFAINELKSIIAPLANGASTDINNLIQLLARHWEYVKKSSHGYDPKSIVTQAFQLAAQFLATQNKAESFYTYLMPSVALHLLKHKAQNTYMGLHEFIMSDDGNTPIPVAEVLRLVERTDSDRKRAQLQCPLRNQPLSASESQRIINHSKLTQDFYDNVVMKGKKVVHGEWKERKTALHKAIQSPNYLNEMSHHQPSQKEITQDAFLNLFALVEPTQQAWQRVIDHVSMQKVSNLLLGADVGQDCEPGLKNAKILAAAKNLHLDSDMLNKAVQFCLLALYRENRQKMGNRTSWLGWTVFAPTKENKLQAVDACLAAIPAAATLSECVQSLQNDSRYASALNDGTLKQILNQGITLNQVQAVVPRLS